MRIAITEETMTVRDAPVGLLRLEHSGELIVKTEYVMADCDNRCQCFIVSTGEYFHGEGDKALVKAVVLI